MWGGGVQEKIFNALRNEKSSIIYNIAVTR
jgi:hypothetical protein